MHRTTSTKAASSRRERPSSRTSRACNTTPPYTQNPRIPGLNASSMPPARPTSRHPIRTRWPTSRSVSAGGKPPSSSRHSAATLLGARDVGSALGGALRTRHSPSRSRRSCGRLTCVGRTRARLSRTLLRSLTRASPGVYWMAVRSACCALTVFRYCLRGL